MARTVDNNGIGALYATFEIHKTGEAYDLTPDHVGEAVALGGNNMIHHGADGGLLLGRLEHVAGGLATVQIAGVMRLGINTSETSPQVGNRVVVDGAGKVYQAPSVTDDPAGGNVACGTVLAVDAVKNTCDVLL